VPAGTADFAERLRALQAPLRRQLVRADVLGQMVRSVNASLDPEQVGQEILAHVSAWLPAPQWLVIVADDAGRIRPVGSRGLQPPRDQSAQAVGSWVMRNGIVFSSADVSRDSRVQAFDGPSCEAAALGLPLECRGRVVGAVVAFDAGPAGREPRLAPATLAALRAVLEPAAFALDNSVRIQRAEALSVTDDLTQLYNSRYLSQALRRESKRASRSGRPLSLLFIDLDGFKSVNDTHGHLMGSRALVEAAGVIRASARETDMVARFGGDEFAVVLPETGSDGARAVGDRIRERVAAHRFLAAEGLSIALTVSIGVATLPDVSISAEGLLHAADDAMYWVKERGKNSIHVAV
jgi:diguanylate cyclase (GGDEF)-like protein